MPDTPSIVIVKSMIYRGVAEEWSNKYHFEGTTPGSAAAWKTLADAIIAQERTMLPGYITFTKAYGYKAGVAASDFQLNYADPPNTVLSGQLGIGNGAYTPGDVAFWIRWATGNRNSKGKPIYLRKYFHGAMTETNKDSLLATQKTAATAYAGKMTDGSLPGGFKVCGPQGASAGAAKVVSFTTTRTLKRRGADPS